MTGAQPSPESTFDPSSVSQFRYVGHDLDLSSGLLRCRYALDTLEFEEQITFTPPTSEIDVDAVRAAATLVYLLAGVSYYKAAAPPTVVVESDSLTPADRRLLHAVYVHGLGEFAYRNDLDLSGVEIVADDAAPVVSSPSVAARPLVPFGGGIDSIVTAEAVRGAAPDAALFVVSKAGDRFEAIEGAAAVSGLPVVRAERRLDPKILRSRELGFRNGHVPVTAILSATAVVAALLDGRDAVVMSNEWSASSGNVERDGRVINHQWSKTLEFEDLLRAALTDRLTTHVEYFSWLRASSELWVAKHFAGFERYHGAFRSCNRAFHIDPNARLDRWCGRCDKCCFIDLILSPFMSRAQLAAVFDGAEPLDDETLLGQFRTLAGLSDDIKPFECVGDVHECQVAALLAARRSDRAASPVLGLLAAELEPQLLGDLDSQAARLLEPMGTHRIPERYAPSTLLG